jgi:hypothetical protein
MLKLHKQFRAIISIKTNGLILQSDEQLSVHFHRHVSRVSLDIDILTKYSSIITSDLVTHVYTLTFWRRIFFSSNFSTLYLKCE